MYPEAESKSCVKYKKQTSRLKGKGKTDIFKICQCRETIFYVFTLLYF